MNIRYEEGTAMGDIIELQFEESDTDIERRIVEQGVALLRNIINGIKEAKGE